MNLRSVPLCVLLLVSCRSASTPQSLVNFSHLKHLTERIAFFGDSVDIIHVYANFPSYDWVDAKESGTEGIACVDDAARAAVVYLRHYEHSGQPQSLEAAKALLRFIRHMETDDGMFYNFVLGDHSINRDGKTSFKSFGWWAARGVWAMSTGYRLLKTSDPAFAELLRSGVERTFPHIDTLAHRYGESEQTGGYGVPRWLLYESASDATSELFLGLTEYYTATNDPRVKEFLGKFAAGFMLMQDGDPATSPYGLHRSWRTIWHMWGNGQTQGLASAGKALGDTNFIRSAEREAQGFYSRLLIHGFMKEFDMLKPEGREEYDQIAYGVRPMAVGLLRLYDATKKEVYLRMAGLSASWLFGNNAARTPMYDPSTGRCFDGIRDSSTINRNSGAESTIEALGTLAELEQYPVAVQCLDYRKISADSTSRYQYALFRNPKGEEMTLVLDVREKSLRFVEGEEGKKFRSSVKED